MQKEIPNVKARTFDSADEFIRFLSPTNRFWKGSQKSWIFRGQRHRELNPSVFRDDVWSRIPHQIFAKYAKPGTVFERILLEAVLLRNFFRGADETAVTIPQDGPGFRNYFSALSIEQLCESLRKLPKDPRAARGLMASELMRAIAANGWPIHEMSSALALAQHNGVPTRFLDWTRGAYTAAYFAANGAVLRRNHIIKEKQNGSEETLSVWCLNLDVSKLNSFNSGYQVAALSIPTAGNSKLAAQRGLFTYSRTPVSSWDNNLSEELTCKSLNDIIVAKLREGTIKSEFKIRNQIVLLKCQLPVVNASQLLDSLNTLGINGATLNPGADGAAKFAIEHIHLGH